jgi:hypothetical protein
MALKGRTFLDCKYRSSSAIVVIIVGLSLPSTVLAQSGMPAESLENSKTTVQPSEGLSFNLPAGPEYTSQTGPLLELPPAAVGSTLFKLDLTNPGCANGSGACLRRSDQLDLGLTDTFRRRSEKGLDLSLTPRASLRFDDEISSTAVGAVIEIGEDLRTGSEFKNNTWYFFAGADAEALTYSPSSVGRITSGEFHLQDRIIVGDAQAGLGYRIGDADVSLSYMRREASTEEFTYKEDAAALSFTWKR